MRNLKKAEFNMINKTIDKMLKDMKIKRSDYELLSGSIKAYERTEYGHYLIAELNIHEEKYLFDWTKVKNSYEEYEVRNFIEYLIRTYPKRNIELIWNIGTAYQIIKDGKPILTK